MIAPLSQCCGWESLAKTVPLLSWIWFLWQLTSCLALQGGSGTESVSFLSHLLFPWPLGGWQGGKFALSWAGQDSTLCAGGGGPAAEGRADAGVWNGWIWHLFHGTSLVGHMGLCLVMSCRSCKSLYRHFCSFLILSIEGCSDTVLTFTFHQLSYLKPYSLGIHFSFPLWSKNNTEISIHGRDFAWYFHTCWLFILHNNPAR